MTPRRAAIACLALLLLCAACDDSPSPATAPSATVTAAPSATAVASTATATAAPTSTPTSPPPATATASATVTATATVTTTATPTQTATPSATAVPVRCQDLAGLEFGEGRVLGATENTGAAGVQCRVSGLIAPKIQFELRLPMGWNRKVVFVGGGGFDGVIPSPDTSGSPGILAAGYATVATDSGHQASPLDASWALADDEAIADYADRARQRVLAVARPIIATHYGRAILRTYFEGGSNGGREALLEAQRRPEDYDGIIARAPVLSFTAWLLSANRLMKQLFREPGGHLGPAALRPIGRSVLEQCDGIDGLEDGIVGDPAGCDRVAAPPLCATPAADCLTAAQQATLALARGETAIGLTLANGVTSHPGYPPSGEEDSSSTWPLWITGFSATAPSSLLFTLQDQFIRYFVVRDAGFDSLTFDAAEWSARLLELSAQLDATADLSDFARRGGKVILWHGVADPAISANQTLRYAESLAGTPGEHEDFLRLYLAPGVDHTGSGRGAPIVDLVGALDAWVEGIEDLGPLTAYKVVGGTTVPFRPLCPYPLAVRYVGSDPGAASSFTCVSPPPLVEPSVHPAPNRSRSLTRLSRNSPSE